MAKFNAQAEIAHLSAHTMAVEILLTRFMQELALSGVASPSVVRSAFAKARDSAVLMGQQLGGSLADVHTTRIRDLLTAMEATIMLA
jgi:hypothetical protein